MANNEPIENHEEADILPVVDVSVNQHPISYVPTNQITAARKHGYMIAGNYCPTTEYRSDPLITIGRMDKANSAKL